MDYNLNVKKVKFRTKEEFMDIEEKYTCKDSWGVGILVSGESDKVLITEDGEIGPDVDDKIEIVGLQQEMNCYFTGLVSTDGWGNRLKNNQDG